MAANDGAEPRQDYSASEDLLRNRAVLGVGSRPR